MAPVKGKKAKTVVLPRNRGQNAAGVRKTQASKKKSNTVRTQATVRKTKNNVSTNGGYTANQTARFSGNSLQTHGFQRFDRVESVGWIRKPVYMGKLTQVQNETNRVIFEFQLKNAKYDAWSAKTKGNWAEKNIKLLEKGHSYVLQGCMLAKHTSLTKYSRSSNSTFRFSVFLGKIEVLKKDDDIGINEPTPEDDTEGHEKILENLNDLLKKDKSFTRKVENVEILSGEMRRYKGCETCYSSKLSKPNKNGKFYCSLCKTVRKDTGVTNRRVCLVIRNLRIKDRHGDILENVVCFQKQVASLLSDSNDPEKVDRLCNSASDLDARAAFEAMIGTQVTVTIKNQLPTGSCKKDFNNMPKLVVENITVTKLVRKIQNDDDGAELVRNPSLASITTVPCFEGGDCPCLEEGDDEEDEDDDDLMNMSYSPELLTPTPQYIYRDYNPDEQYVLSPTRDGYIGLALIVNVSDKRKGSEVDVRSLVKMFWKVGISVFDVLWDVSRSELEKAIELFKFALLQGNYSSSFFVSMSHGSLYTINLKDGKLNIYKDILPHFGTTHFRDFDEKPKIFIFQACQHFINTKVPAVKVDDTQDISNYLELFPCRPGIKAKRSKKYGSYFIQTLARVFEAEWRNMDIEQMMKKIQKIMRGMRMGKKKMSINVASYRPSTFNRFGPHFNYLSIDYVA